MSNAHYARPERAWENIPTIPATTDEELAELELQPEDPTPRQRRDNPHLIRIRKPNGQIAPTPDDHEHLQLFANCAKQYGITVAQLRGRSNARSVVRARWLVMMALNREGLSQPRISQILGGGKHSSGVHYGLEAGEIALASDEQFAKAWMAVSGETLDIPETPRWKQGNKTALFRSGKTMGALLQNQKLMNAKLDELLRRTACNP